MSQITEQEAREAAAFIADIGNGANEHAPKLLAALMMNILSRRDAERAEREKPITAEWCLANGATLDGTAGACQFIAHGIEVEWDARNGVTVRDGERMGDWTFLSSITTRGQLLDLLRALKGGCVNP